ncbi:putative MFS monosaccharide transporter [Aureobasidium pullulans]|nr:putative MFS monosaccharide transporter [Aureobasidium pullulans]
MAPVGTGTGNVSAARARLSGPSGMKGIIASGKTTGIAFFASLGGFVYGYNQGMFAQVLTMNSFIKATQGYAATTGIDQGLLTSILELGAWVGTLINGYLADAVGRRWCAMIACVVFTVGVIVQACTVNKDYVLGGRFVTGLGVGSLSMVVPLYNAELSPPEIRGSLVAVQQLAITFGIMISFWIGYGTNFIGGTGDGQSSAAWLIPICIQILPALVLGAGMLLFMPESPRHLMNQDREDEALTTLARLRNKSTEDMGVRVEYLEIKALRDFEVETARAKYPQYQDGSFKSNFLIGFHDYASLITNPSLRRRTMAACFTMTFQQWNGINAINYYAPFIFKNFGFQGNTLALLATGVVGVIEFLLTIPAVLYVDKFGRKSILLAGAIGMGTCHFIVAGLVGTYENSWSSHLAAGWVCIVFVWVFIANFAYSWGPVSWIVVSEVFPLSMRAKGVSLGGSANWLNNFAVGISTSPFIEASQFGAFIFFGCMCVLAALWVYFMLPETKGLTLEEMDELFGDAGFAQADLALKQRIEKDIGLTALLYGDDEPMMTDKVTTGGKGEEREFKEDAKSITRFRGDVCYIIGFEKLGLVKTVFVTGLTPFHSIESSWPAQLVTVRMSGGVQPESMEGLQHVLLDTFSRSRADGAAILAEQWRNSKRHHDAWREAENAPVSNDNPFPRFTKQMIACMRSEAAEGVAQVFNLIEYAGVANRLTNALKVLENKHSAAYQAYLTWYGMRGSHTGGRGTYESVRKFVIAKSVNAVFAHIPRDAKKDNLGLVSAMVRRAEVLRGMETAYGAGVFVLFLGFDWKSRIDKWGFWRSRKWRWENRPKENIELMSTLAVRGAAEETVFNNKHLKEVKDYLTQGNVTIAKTSNIGDLNNRALAYYEANHYSSERSKLSRGNAQTKLEAIVLDIANPNEQMEDSQDFEPNACNKFWGQSITDHWATVE